MSDSTRQPLSMLSARSGDPRIVINGKDYAGNIPMGGVTVQALTPVLTGNTAASVTVTFLVDDLRILSNGEF